MSQDDPRLGSIITQGDQGDIIFMGFPQDEGVRRNGGRVGAKGGPEVVRRFVQKVGTVVNPEKNIDLNTIKISDFGNISCSESLEDDHEKLNAAVGRLLSQGKIPFVVGGGNDQSFPNGYALLKHYQKNVGVINIDAHLDVRPLKEGKTHSGSPFRQLLESPEWKANGSNNCFIEFAAQGEQCSATHAQYVTDQGGAIAWLGSIRKKDRKMANCFKDALNDLGEHIFVSFDIDSIASSDCPGVSAPAAVGLSAQEALNMCYVAGAHPNVKLFDVSEFNPSVEEYRTGRLVAFMFYYFCMGYATRRDK